MPPITSFDLAVDYLTDWGIANWLTAIAALAISIGIIAFAARRRASLDNDRRREPLRGGMEFVLIVAWYALGGIGAAIMWASTAEIARHLASSGWVLLLAGALPVMVRTACTRSVEPYWPSNHISTRCIRIPTLIAAVIGLWVWGIDGLIRLASWLGTSPELLIGLCLAAGVMGFAARARQ